MPCSDSKFFGHPNGSKANPQQSTLAFSTPKATDGSKHADGEAKAAIRQCNGPEAVKDEEADGDVEMETAVNLKPHTISKGKPADSGARTTLEAREGSNTPSIEAKTGPLPL